MRVLIGAFGTRGDVQPMLALGQALRVKGHAVTLVVPPESKAFAERFGFDAHVAGLSYEEISRRTASGKLTDTLAVVPLMRAEVGAHFKALEPLARDADIIVGASVFIAGTSLAELLKKPFVYVALMPLMLDSPEHPGPLARSYRWPRWVNRLYWWMTRLAWDLMTRGVLNRVRRGYGLKPVRSIWRAILGSHPLLAADATLAPAPKEHPFPITQVGPMLLDDASPLSASTEQFLAAGAPPVYLGFGSMSDPHPERTTRRLLESARRAKVRAIVSRGWAGLGVPEASPDVHFIDSEPHAKLFPRCSAVVHHGGAGTTHAAARAGVPQLVLPQILDQFFWRHRTLELGVNPLEVARYGDDPEPLANALKALTSDAQLRDRARALAAQMPGDGAARAVELLERLAAR